MRIRLLALALMALAHAAAADSLEGRWKLLAAEDVRDNGEVVRHPWGEHPVGSIVVQGGWLYLQIMSGDTPSFASDKPLADQMKAMLTSSYIAYAGPVNYRRNSRQRVVQSGSRLAPELCGNRPAADFPL